MTTTVAVPRPHDKVEAGQIRPMRYADLEATERTCGHVLVDDACATRRYRLAGFTQRLDGFVHNGGMSLTLTYKVC